MNALTGTTEPTADAWLVLYWMLLNRGDHRAAFAAKDRFAQMVLAEPVRSPSAAIRAVQATAYLEGPGAALCRLADEPDIARLIGPSSYQRVLADLELMTGDPARHRSLSPPDRLTTLLAGRTVAIAGPTPLSAIPLATTADHDVVIRTKAAARHAHSGDRTDVAYYAENSANVLASEVEQLLDEGSLRLAVLRTASSATGPPALLRRSDVRVMPNEFSLGLESSLYGLSRIVYDVLRSNPSEISLHDADFFVSGVYADGYHRDIEALEKQGLQPNAGGYGHDLRSDHAFMAGLVAAGLINCSDAVASRILLSSDQYLAGLDTARA